MILLIGVLGLMSMAVQVQDVRTAAGVRYDLNKIVTLVVVNNTEKTYYEDGFLEGLEELKYSITAAVAPPSSQLPPLQLFRQTEYDLNSRKLICVFDSADKCTSGPCQLRTLPMKTVHQLEIRLTATQALNNTRLGLRLAVQGGAWIFLTPVIRLHPVPVFSVSFDDREVDIDNCVYSVAHGEDFVVEFCSENLKNPSLQLSLHDGTGEEVKHKCSKQKFSVTTRNIRIQLVYKDSCKVYGSFMCSVYAHNPFETTTTNYTFTPFSVPPPSSSGPLGIIFLTLLTLLVIAGVLALTAFVYKESKKRRERQKESKKRSEKDKRTKSEMTKKRPDPKLTNIICEVYTGTPSAVSTDYVETEATTVRNDFVFT